MIPAKILSVMLKSNLREGFHLYKLSVIQQKAFKLNCFNVGDKLKRSEKEELCKSSMW